MAKQTVLYNEHSLLGARFTEFGGWEMPIQYSGLSQEHLAVRQKAGIFDVCHMGEFLVEGPHAFEFLQYLTSNDLSCLSPGRAQYSLFLNELGAVVDDIIVYQLAEQKYFLCVNAANTEIDFAWCSKHNTFGAKLRNVSDAYGQIALQGPRALEILGLSLGLAASELSLKAFPSFSLIERTFFADAGEWNLLIARTGYTGEDGVEIFVPQEATCSLWRQLLAAGKPAGLVPAGLGARDTLRLESALPLHGHELNQHRPALECGVGWAVKSAKGDFIGREAVLKLKERGVERKLVGLELIDPGISRAEDDVLEKQGLKVGVVTSGTKTPWLQKSIALAFVYERYAEQGTELYCAVRGKRLAAKVVPRPFYRKATIAN